MPVLTKEDRDALAEHIAKAREIKARAKAPRVKITQRERRERDKAIDRTRPEQRAPRVKDPAYLQWLRRLPCVACGSRERVEAAHVRAGYPSAGWRPTGMQEKPDDVRAVPLCALDHREGPDAQHRANERAWWNARGIDPPDLCAALRRAYETDEDGAAVLRRFTPSRPFPKSRREPA